MTARGQHQRLISEGKSDMMRRTTTGRTVYNITLGPNERLFFLLSSFFLFFSFVPRRDSRSGRVLRRLPMASKTEQDGANTKE